MKSWTFWGSTGVVLLGLLALVWALLSGVVLEGELSFFLHPPAVQSSYRVFFGTVQKDSEGSVFFDQETAVLPLRFKESNFRYGIKIEPSNDRPYSYYCVYHFSAPPKIITGDTFEGTVSSTILQTKEVQMPGGVAIDENWFDPGDPLGDQSVDVFVNGKLVKTCKYKVVPDDQTHPL